VLAEVEPMLNNYDDATRLRVFAALEARLDEMRGSVFSSATLSNVAPMSPYHWTSLFLVHGREKEKDRAVRAVAVGANYFETMRIPLRSGRLPNIRDDERSQRIAVISESLARREFPDENPIGKRFTSDLRRPEESTYEIVGVVADILLYDPRTDAHRACVYFPYREWAFPPQALTAQVRVAGAARRLRQFRPSAEHSAMSIRRSPSMMCERSSRPRNHFWPANGS
jgi:hypothetical protein